MAKRIWDVKGEIVLKSPNEVEWKVANFFLLPEAEVYIFESPSFPYLDGTWCLICWPNVLVHGTYIVLRRIHSTSHHNITFRLGIKDKDGLEYISRIRNSDFEKDGRGWGCSLHVRRAYLQKYKTDFSQRDDISFFCMLSSGSSKDAVSRTIRSKVKDAATETPDLRKSQKKYEDDRGASEELTGASKHTEENVVNFNKKDGEGDDTKLEFTTKLGVNNLVQNFRDLLLKEEQSDILVKVKDKEFKAHKTILRGRSNVFSSMFAYDTLEKRTNIVEITDCEPDAFMQFLMYIYTGQVERVPGDQVFDLYNIADKYNVEDLKVECVNFMKDHMTVDTFCDVMSLALSHNEMALIESATKYFADNIMEIIVTSKWITFVKENPVESNEIHIKALKYGNKN